MDLNGLDIKKKGGSAIAPTPNNTPLNTAPISSSAKPTLPTMKEEDDNLASNLSKLPNSALLEIIQGRLDSLMGRKSGYIQSLPEEVQTRINGLKGLQIKQAELESQFNKEVFELENKYLKLYQPLFEERSAIVNGIKEPSADDIESGAILREEEEENEGESLGEIPKQENKMNGIPEFWLTALKNHPDVLETINDEDEKALKSLIDITYRFFDDQPGFAIDFSFGPNDYFTNSILTKKYFYAQGIDFGEYLLDRSEGCDIDWKEGKNLTVEVTTKKQVHKITQETRVITKEIPVDSFFSFFSTMVPPSEEDENYDQLMKEYEIAMEADYALGEELKCKIIPHAIDWFTGKAIGYNYSNEDEFFDEEEGLEDLTEEDEDEE